MKRKILLLSMGIILTFSGCSSISQEEYDEKVSELESAEEKLSSSQDKINELQSEVNDMEEKLAESQEELEQTKNSLEQTSKQLQKLQEEKPEPEDTETENTDTAVSAGEEIDNTSLKTPSTLKYGKLLEANPNGGTDGNTLVIKAKIEPNLTNDLTISQNYHNIIDLVTKQGCDSFDSIDYWAVADMADGSEDKVISFLVNSDCIKGIKDETIVATTLDQYLEDLWILPSLQQ